MKSQARGNVKSLRGRSGRRGSVLVLVVGVLALMAIIVVVYATIGQADRRGSAALARQARVADQAQAVGDYLAGLIGRSAFKVRAERDLSGEPRLVRVAADYPGVDPLVVSSTSEASSTLGLVPGNAAAREALRFDATGSIDETWPVRSQPDPRQSGTPWLATALPEWLNPASGAFPVGRSWADASEPSEPVDLPWVRMRDWGQISNTSPDGRFVNLWALRNNFGAESGFGVDASGRPRTSFGLTLFTPSGLAQPIDRADGSGGVLLADGGTEAEQNRPAHWSSGLLGAFRPLRLPADVNAGYTVSSPEWVPYQWADADGDGIIDARWQELVDASDAAGPRSVLGGAGGGGPARLFYAARIVDLSGKVNVNTATHQFTPPTGDHPLGVTPADVNLQRVLALTHAYEELPQVGGGGGPVAGPGYEFFSQPAVSFDGAGGDPANYRLETAYFTFASALGRGAQQQIFRQIAGGGDPASGPSYDAAAQAPSDAASRALAYSLLGRDPSGFSLAGVSAAGEASTFSALPFGLGDELELRTYDGLNNPVVTSRLEAAAGGRAGPDAAHLSPLRDNRPLSLERLSRDRIDNGTLPATRLLSDGALDYDIYLQAQIDARRLITTLSGARPLASVDVTGRGSALSADELKLDVSPLLTTVLRWSNPASSPRPTLLDRDQALRALFDRAAGALAPWAGEAGPGNTSLWDPGLAAARPLAYGATVGPPVDPAGFAGNTHERALRIAAHWMANLVELSRDPASVLTAPPGSYTLLVDRGAKADLDQGRADVDGDGLNDFPFWLGTDPLLTGPGGPLELPGARLAPTGTPLAAQAINIFGAGVQPFVTQATSLIMYTDTPVNPPGGSAGDREWSQSPNPGGGPDIIVPGPVTIEGSIVPDNPDYLVEVVAVQIHNPFEVPIVLGPAGAGPGATLAPAQVRYYVELCGKFYALGDSDGEGREIRTRVIPAGGTVNFYAMDQTVPQVLTRWRNVSGDVPAADDATPRESHPFYSWIDGQLRVGTGPEGIPGRMAQVDPTTFEPIVPSGVDLGVVDRVFPDNNRVVRLWRVVRDATETTTNGRRNDVLVDRLRDPGDASSTEPALEARIPAGNQPIDGTQAGPDPTVGLAGESPRDNTGFTVTLWGSIRRPADPLPGAAAGAMPAWCLETKSSLAPLGLRAAGVVSLNTRNLIPDVDRGVPTVAAFRSAAGGAEFYNAGGTGAVNQQTTSPACPHVRVEPKDQTGNPLPNGGLNLSGLPLAGPDAALAGGTVARHAVLPRVATGSSWSLRPADLLLPLGVGPWHSPLSVLAGAGGVDDPRNLDVQWTTLSEALALGLDYDSPSSPTDPEYRIGGTAGTGAAGAVDGALRSGHLRTDAFVPYVDANGDGVRAALTDSDGDGVIDAGESARGLGLPLAMNLLDRLRTTRFGDLSSMATGVINLNTAPLAVLRALPLTAPESAGWMGASSTVYDPVQNGGSVFDVAAAMMAYRDKSLVLARPIRGSPTSWMEINFRDDNTGVPPTTVFAGRATATGISGVREEPGLSSVGEVLAVRLADAAPLPGLSVWQKRDVSIDRLGRDGQANAFTDGSSLVNGVVPSFGTGSGAAVDDRAEALAVANALLNSASVRSDVFVCWFVVHGYVPGDVEGLTADDPLVPSIARRYVMVVDRSTMTNTLERPKILMFEEVPLSE